MIWTVRLSDSAQRDFGEIVEWTAARFGERQAVAYSDLLIAAMQDLHAGPKLAGVKRRDDIGKNILTLHVSRSGRKGRHFLMLRACGEQPGIIEVVRILHDVMDLPRHLP